MLALLFTVQAVTPAKNPSCPEPIFQVENTKDKTNAIFFTFNLLWGEQHLDVLLKILDQHKIKAIFFMSGHWLTEYPQEAKNIINRGHQIGNHTFSYCRLLSRTEAEIKAEVHLFNNLCQEITHTKPVFFRPPYGEYNPLIARIAHEDGCFTLLWTVNALTLSNLEAELVMSRIEEQVHAGAVMLLHTSPQVVEILPQIIAFLKWKGYTFASPDLIREYAESKYPLPGR